MCKCFLPGDVSSSHAGANFGLEFPDYGVVDRSDPAEQVAGNRQPTGRVIGRHSGADGKRKTATFRRDTRQEDPLVLEARVAQQAPHLSSG